MKRWFSSLSIRTKLVLLAGFVAAVALISSAGIHTTAEASCNRLELTCRFARRENAAIPLAANRNILFPRPRGCSRRMRAILHGSGGIA